jgi:hypothetical protein
MLRLALLEAVDCHKRRPRQGSARYHHEKPSLVSSLAADPRPGSELDLGSAGYTGAEATYNVVWRKGSILGASASVERAACRRNEIPAARESRYRPTGIGGRGASSLAPSGSWRSICSSVDNTPVPFSAAGAAGDCTSATGRESISSGVARLGSRGGLRTAEALGWSAADGVPERSAGRARSAAWPGCDRGAAAAAVGLP